MASVGIVLGAGAIVGAAYHAWALTALAESGIDAPNTGVIAGESAGSVIGATLRAGFPPIDLAPRNLGEPISAKAGAIVERAGGPPTFNLRPRPFSRLPVPASPLLWRASGGRPGKALAVMLPTGTVSADPIDEADQIHIRRSSLA